MSWLELVRIFHIGVGVLAFVVLPVPLAARKGSKLHVTFGRIYAYAMGTLAVTGVPLAARGLFFDDPRRRANALFLFFIALLASDNAWIGIRALRAARRGASQRNAIDLAPPSALLVGSLGLLVLGLERGAALYLFFALLGGFLASSQIAYCLRPAHGRVESVVRHISGMGVSCITTITAFLVTNARYLFHLGAFNIVVWVTPAALGAIGIGVAQRRWRDRLTRATVA
jgi:hypothetical protein